MPRLSMLSFCLLRLFLKATKLMLWALRLELGMSALWLLLMKPALLSGTALGSLMVKRGFCGLFSAQRFPNLMRLQKGLWFLIVIILFVSGKSVKTSLFAGAGFMPKSGVGF